MSGSGGHNGNVQTSSDGGVTNTASSSTIGSIIKSVGSTVSSVASNISSTVQSAVRSLDDKAVLQESAQTVKLKLYSTISGSTVLFDIQPDGVSEQGSVIYDEIANIRYPSSILIYSGTPARTFSINTIFLSRTKDEAVDTFRKIHLIKSWRMPKKLANTPETLRIQGFGTNLKAIPVVLMSYSLDMSSESDTINFGGGIVLPVVTKISIQLKEAQGNADIKAFDRDMFSKGQLPKW